MELKHFHAHVYFDPGQQEVAFELRQELVSRFQLPVGRVYSRPIGPHSKGMFQALFRLEQFSEVVTWLMQHRRGLDILVHGDTGDDITDHTKHVMWLGKSLPLNLDALETD